MKYARYISETEIAFPPANKYIGGQLVLGYNLRTDLLSADGYKLFIDSVPTPPSGMVADGFTYQDDGSAIRKEWSYKPAVPEDAQLTTQAIINRIAAVVVKYNAIEDVKAIEDINIESLLALAAEKGVTDEDMAALKGDIVMLKTDLEGKMDANWYSIWNDWLKGAISDAMKNMELMAQAAQEEALQEQVEEPPVVDGNQ